MKCSRASEHFGACLGRVFQGRLWVFIIPITCQVFFMSLRICILETDILRPELIDQYQGYGHMFQRLFSQQPIAADFTVYNVVKGNYPSDDEAFDAYLVTGSRKSSNTLHSCRASHMSDHQPNGQDYVPGSTQPT